MTNQNPWCLLNSQDWCFLREYGRAFIMTLRRRFQENEWTYDPETWQVSHDLFMWRTLSGGMSVIAQINYRNTLIKLWKYHYGKYEMTGAFRKKVNTLGIIVNWSEIFNERLRRCRFASSFIKSGWKIIKILYQPISTNHKS